MANIGRFGLTWRFVLVAAALMAIVLASSTSSRLAFAAPGDPLDSFDASVTAGIPGCASGIGTGVAFDGTSLILSCWGDNILEQVRAAAPHDNMGSVVVAGLPFGSSIEALAWDAGRGKLWACNSHGDVVLIDVAAGAVDGAQPSIPMTSGCTDGLAYDGSDDTLWASADVEGTIHHYSVATGLEIGSFPLAGLIGGCGNSGIAVGGANMYLANNGCSEIYQTDKTFTSSTLFASFPRRLEDLECDGITFAGLGVGAIWSNDAYDRILNAWEIEPGLCEFGGGGNGDTQAPEASCVETVNPAGNNIPKAPAKGGQGQNQDGFYELLATDDVDLDPQIWVTDTGTGTMFGPFPSGTKIKYVEANGAVPSIQSMAGPNSAVDWMIKGQGDASVSAVDAAGNVSPAVSCLVPPPPM